MNVKSLKMFLIVIVLGILLAGCNSNNNDEKNAAKENENATIITGIKNPIETLDPANHRDRVTESVIRNLFDGLVTKDENGEVQPMIAESWENPTPTEWIFKIREGIQFHDGSDLTADDVVYTFNRIITEGAMEGASSPRKGLLGTMKEVTKEDDFTVKFTFESPWPIFLKMLPHQQIVPKKYIEEVGEVEFREHPIGAGPFKFVEAKLDERIVLERFEEYYGNVAKVKNLVFDIIPETSSRVAALQAGEVQRIHAVTPSLAEELKKDPDLEVKSVNGTRVAMIEMNTQNKPFDDVNVRKAMNHAVDMDKIVSSLFGEYGVRLAGSMLPGSFSENTDLKPYAYDPEKAKALLKEAGYEDGFSVVIDTIDEHKEVAEAVASELRKINIDANTRIWDVGVLKDLLLKGERQMSVMDWGNSTMDPYDILNPKLKTGDRGNYSLYSNEKVDELLVNGEIELDEGKRAEMYKEAQQIIYDDAPWVFGYALKEIEAGTINLQNWKPNSDGMLYMSEVEIK